MILFEPERWPEIDESTPRRDAGGLLQGAAAEVGAGRVVILGEVAFLRLLTRDADSAVAGLDNARFALNLFRWLAGRLRRHSPGVCTDTLERCRSPTSRPQPARRSL